MKRARLWEDTIVLALRDQQWLRRLKHVPEVSGDPPGALPPGMIKLDGQAESKIGDVALKQGERFFIFEVKPELFRIRDEWTKGGKFKPKVVFETLRDLTKRTLSQDARLDDHKNLERSFRCHYFAYWWLLDEDDQSTNGAVLVEPYIPACAQLRNNGEVVGKECMPALRNRLKFIGETGLRDRIGLKDLFGSSMRTQSIGKKHDCGLERHEFQEYVNFLCESNGSQGSGEPIHAVVLSSLGSFFRVVSDTNHLASLLDHELRPEPVDLRAKSRAIERLQKFSISLGDGK